MPLLSSHRLEDDVMPESLELLDVPTRGLFSLALVDLAFRAPRIGQLCQHLAPRRAFTTAETGDAPWCSWGSTPAAGPIARRC